MNDLFDRLFRWWYGRPYRLLVTFRWSESPEWLKASYVITAHSRTEAAAKAVVWAQRGVDVDWVSVMVEDAPTIPPDPQTPPTVPPGRGA